MSSYGRRQGQAWARRHPKGSAILGIVIGLLFTVVGFAAKQPIIGTLCAIYTVYCIYLLITAK